MTPLGHREGSNLPVSEREGEGKEEGEGEGEGPGWWIC